MVVLITGGQRSGKSLFAETLLANKIDVVYFATAENQKTDSEMQDRIKKHQARRNPEWRTVECYKNFAQHLGSEKYYLLDCVTNSVSRFMFEFTGHKEKILQTDFDKTLNSIKKTFSDLVKAVKEKNLNLILVTNEVGSAITPMNSLGRMFVDLQGMTNAFIASLCDEVYFCVSGIPLKVK